MEQLLGGDLAIDQALLVSVLRQRRDLAHVLLDAVRPEVVPHNRHGFLRFRDQPGERHHQGVDVEEIGHGQCLGLAERLVDAGRQPRIFPYEFFADSDEMHEREHASLFVVSLLDLARVREQALDVRLAAQER